MTNSKIKKLALLSYKKGKLNLTMINKIIKILKRKDLKLYIKHIKQLEEKNTITVVLPKKDNRIYFENRIKKLYRDKKIKYDYDETLITGIKIIDNDLIYEYNLKDTINKISNHIMKNI